MPPQHKPVAIIMGSQSDWPVMAHAAEVLSALEIGFEALVVSAHRTPERMVSFAKGAKDAGFSIIIAGAGGAAHLPGMTAALTPLPVFGVPIEGKVLGGQDSLLSIVQMPAGVPVGTLAVGKAGAINAALLAAAVLALHDDALADPAGEPGARRRRLPFPSIRREGVSVVLAPGATIGILGGGQLGRMIALAAAKLGLRAHVYCPDDGPGLRRRLRADDRAPTRTRRPCAPSRRGRRRHLRVRERAGAHGGGARGAAAGAPRRRRPRRQPGPPRRKGISDVARHPHRPLLPTSDPPRRSPTPWRGSAARPSSRRGASATTARAR